MDTTGTRESANQFGWEYRRTTPRESALGDSYHGYLAGFRAALSMMKGE